MTQNMTTVKPFSTAATGQERVHTSLAEAYRDLDAILQSGPLDAQLKAADEATRLANNSGEEHLALSSLLLGQLAEKHKPFFNTVVVSSRQGTAIAFLNNTSEFPQAFKKNFDAVWHHRHLLEQDIAEKVMPLVRRARGVLYPVSSYIENAY